jgi:hypothetical protein
MVFVEYGGRAMPAGAVLLIKTRAITELIRGWDSYQKMQDWLASRGTTGSGTLAAPPAARRARCVAEEAVLSHMLGHAEHVTAIGAYLPPWTSRPRLRQRRPVPLRWGCGWKTLRPPRSMPGRAPIRGRAGSLTLLPHPGERLPPLSSGCRDTGCEHVGGVPGWCGIRQVRSE